jgi:hypothetical protein
MDNNEVASMWEKLAGVIDDDAVEHDAINNDETGETEPPEENIQDFHEFTKIKNIPDEEEQFENEENFL